MRSQFSYNSNNFHKKIKKQFGGFPTYGSYNVEYDFKDDWSIERKGTQELAGYFSSLSESNGGVVLSKDQSVVMSLTPMELESHIMAQHSAQGHVVVSGLGLAMIVLSLLQKTTVRKITVLEVDPQIISMYPSVLNGQSRCLWEDSIKDGRLNVIEADCHQPLPQKVLDEVGTSIDYMWCDTWNTLGHSKSLFRTQLLAQQIKPKVCDFWGVELYLAMKTVIQNPSLQAKPLIDYAYSTGLPLSVLKMDTKQARLYTELCYAAAKNITIQERARARLINATSPNIFA
ncbi:hypothetical protein [Vibrio sp. R78045]|uniref:hypothetical protein n=1 Tax=Vibrio sp. R78045 TaxID=3093868 RepID=UPI0036F342DE